MKKNISWQVLIIIGLSGDLIGRFTIGVIGDAIGVVGDICFLIGMANMIVYFVKKRKIKKEQKKNFIEESTIEIEKEKELNIAKNRTISYLESNIWYRTLKVFYLIFFMLILIFCNIIIFDNIPDNLTSSNETANLISESVSKKILNDEESNKISRSSKKTGFDFETFGTEVSQPQKQLQAQPANAIWYFIGNLIIGNLLILLFFEVLRRVFYYIILGSLRPQK